MYIACKYMCRRVSLTGGSRGGTEVEKAYASCCAAKAAAEKSYAYNMATALSRRLRQVELVDAPAYTSLPSIALVVIQSRVSKEATGIVWAAGAENDAGAKAEDAEVYGAKGGRGDIKRRGEGKRLWCGGKPRQARPQKPNQQTKLKSINVYVETRSSGPPSDRGCL